METETFPEQDPVPTAGDLTHKDEELDESQNTGGTGAGETGQTQSQDETIGATATGAEVTEGEGDRPLPTEGANDDEDEEEILQYCLICNNRRDKQQSPPGKEWSHYTSTVSSKAVNKDELKETVFIALDIEVNEESKSPIVDPNFRLPLCSNCKHKCGQLNHISSQMAELEREFGRIRESMAFTICDTVADGAHVHEYNDENEPLRNAKESRQGAINFIQAFIYQNWWARYLENEMTQAHTSGSEDTISNMRQTVSSLPYHPPPKENVGQKKIVHAGNPSVKKQIVPQTNFKLKASSGSTSSASSFNNLLLKGTAPTRIRRTAASVQKERSEMLRRGLKIPELSGGSRAVKAGLGFLKQFGFNQNGNDMGLPPRQSQPSNSRIRPVHQNIPGRRSMQQSPGTTDYSQSGHEEEDSNDMDDGMDQYFGGGNEEFVDWSSQQSPEELLKNYDEQFGHLNNGGGGHFLEGGGHFMDGGGHFMEGGNFLDDGGGYDNSEAMDNDDEGSLNDDQGDIEYHQNAEGLYVCTFCNKQFIHKYPYRDHLKTHTGEGPKCNVCGKIFPKNHNLMLHMRTHTGEKPFQCEICYKGFADKSNLKVHMRVHTGERPYQCGECGLSFVNSSRLVVHQKMHAEEKLQKIFSCDICQKSFGTANQLHSHRKNHFANSSSKGSSSSAGGQGQVSLKQERQRQEMRQEQEMQSVNTTSSRSGRTIIPKRRAF